VQTDIVRGAFFALLRMQPTMLRDGTPVVLVTVNASAEGIDQILWIMRPSKLAAVSASGQRVGESDPTAPAAS